MTTFNDKALPETKALKTKALKTKALKTKTLEVIYNSVCPVCDAGVCKFQKKVDPARGHYVWLDINSAPERLAGYGISMDDVLSLIHI